MSTARLVVRQLRYENAAFWRNPASAFFTFAFPLIFMVIFNVVFSSQAGLSSKDAAAFFTPGIVCFALINACYTTLAMTVTVARDEGILKRIHGTPLPTWAYLAARMLLAMIITLILVVIVSLFGYVAYGVSLPLAQLPALLLTLAIGAASFCALGLAVSGLIPNAASAPAIVNATILPLYFVSDVFVHIERGSSLATVGGFFPIRPLAEALQSVYSPALYPPLDPMNLLWVAAWGVFGVVVALRTFTWEPRV
jgi:ABC-2 type transport system permease protein